RIMCLLWHALSLEEGTIGKRQLLLRLSRMCQSFPTGCVQEILCQAESKSGSGQTAEGKINRESDSACATRVGEVEGERWPEDAILFEVRRQIQGIGADYPSGAQRTLTERRDGYMTKALRNSKQEEGKTKNRRKRGQGEGSIYQRKDGR